MSRRYPVLIGCATLATLMFASPPGLIADCSAQDVDVRAGQTEVQVDRPNRQIQREQRRNRQIAEWLLAEQRSLIELAEFGLQRSKTPEVRQLAENLIRDHQAMVEKLERAAEPPATEPSSATPAQREDRREVRREADDQGRPLENLAERVEEGLERIGEGAERVAERARDAVERNLADDRGAANWVGIHREIANQLSQVVREDLEQREGAEFDAAFVGMVVAAHLQQRASLDVLSQRAAGDLATTLRGALETTKQHQQQAEQTMKGVQRP